MKKEPPLFETIQLKKERTLAHLILNRPENKNAINQQMLKELPKAARWLNEQLDIRIVIISGTNNIFSVGADLKEATAGITENSWIERREIGQLGARMIEAIEKIRAITIAQVEKYAIGGGLLIMLACDFRIVAENTVFRIPEVELGIPLAWGGIPKLVREIGPLKTKELVMTCRKFSTEEALNFGLVNQVVEKSGLASSCLKLANDLLDKPTVPLLITKEHINSVVSTMGDAASRYADGDVLMSALNDPGFLEAAAAYLQKTINSKS